MRRAVKAETGFISRLLAAGLATLALLAFGGCSSNRTTLVSPAYSIARNQTVLPVLPFTSILVPETFSENVFNDFIDDMNENQGKAGFKRTDIIKDDLSEVERILTPAHVYVSGELWGYVETSGCCATEIRVKSRLRLQRVRSREILWEMEIPVETFFEHDKSTLAVERDKLSKRLARTMSDEAIKILRDAKRISLE